MSLLNLKLFFKKKTTYKISNKFYFLVDFNKILHLAILINFISHLVVKNAF